MRRLFSLYFYKKTQAIKQRDQALMLKSWRKNPNPYSNKKAYLGIGDLLIEQHGKEEINSFLERYGTNIKLHVVKSTRLTPKKCALITKKKPKHFFFEKGALFKVKLRPLISKKKLLIPLIFKKRPFLPKKRVNKRKFRFDYREFLIDKRKRKRKRKLKLKLKRVYKKLEKLKNFKNLLLRSTP